MPDFDDSAWNNADISRGTNVAPNMHKGIEDRANIDNNAYWIWATGYPTKTTQVYCRKSLVTGSLFATCDNEMEVFLDGVKYTDDAMKDWKNTSEVSIPPHTEVIAIYQRSWLWRRHCSLNYNRNSY